jgi:hypothetical protein
MVLISNSQRDEAVRYLQRFADLTESVTENDGNLMAVNLCRLARRLAKQLKKKQCL